MTLWSGTNGLFRGPLVFCLILSLFLSIAKGDQASLVFSGVFCIVWIGEAAVTLQIKLLGGKMYVIRHLVVMFPLRPFHTNVFAPKILLPVNLHHRLHSLSLSHRRASQCFGPSDNRQNPRLPRPSSMVIGCRRKYSGWFGRGAEPCRHCGIPSLCVLYCHWMSLFH